CREQRAPGGGRLAEKEAEIRSGLRQRDRQGPGGRAVARVQADAAGRREGRGDGAVSGGAEKDGMRSAVELTAGVLPPVGCPRAFRPSSRIRRRSRRRRPRAGSLRSPWLREVSAAGSLAPCRR